MTRIHVAAVTTMSLLLASATPALAQDHRFAGFEGVRGANATINLRIPFGASPRGSRPTFDLTVAIGRTLGAGTDGEPIVRQMPLADFRFSGAGLAHARVASFDLANLDRDRRLNVNGGKKTTMYLAAAAAAAAAAICAFAGCFDGDDDETPGDSNTATPG
jgi:hypothetical protein